MFYRIRDGKIYDYADYEYAEDCLYSDACTMRDFQQNPQIFVLINDVLTKVENYQDVIALQRKNIFEKEFFNTTLGWIRRKVTMKDGSVKDFLSDLLLPIKAGMELGQDVEIITYKTPDFSNDLNLEYLKSLQETKFATQTFIQECLYQTVKDFSGEAGGNNGI